MVTFPSALNSNMDDFVFTVLVVQAMAQILTVVAPTAMRGGHIDGW